MFAIIPHGWFLHAGSNRLYRTAAQTTLTKKFLPKLAEADNHRVVVITAPEPEAMATANEVALIGGFRVLVDNSLSDKSESPPPRELIARLSATNDPAVLVSHRRRLKAIKKAVDAAAGVKIKITGRRPFFRNQALIVDPATRSIEVESIK